MNSPAPVGRSTLTCSASARHHLPANAQTVHWGYFSRFQPPVLEVRSGDVVTIECLTHHAYDDYERMIRGDAGAESVFRWTATDKAVDRRGAGPMDASTFGRGAGEGFGVHICTGPVAVAGAEPGDVLEVQILSAEPRLSRNPQFAGRAFGSNVASFWGFQYDDLLTEPKRREVVTIYELDCAKGGRCAHAVYSFRYTPQTDPFGVVHATMDYPGVPIDHDTVTKTWDVLKDIEAPVRPHFGVIGLAPDHAGLVDSVPPSYFGGNLDNWRLGAGSAVYLPVSVEGALLSVGDPHAAQGDGEICGTAIECSLTGAFRLILHKKADLTDKPLGQLDYPLIETEDEWVISGFSHPDYLNELGSQAQSEVYRKSSVDLAMRDAFRKARRFLMSYRDMSEDEAISLMSVAVDFGVTQVVDGNWGVHAVIRKSLFQAC